MGQCLCLLREILQDCFVSCLWARPPLLSAIQFQDPIQSCLSVGHDQRQFLRLISLHFFILLTVAGRGKHNFEKVRLLHIRRCF